MSRPALLLCLLALTGARAHAAEPPEAKVEHIVVEDDANRVEEVRVRGQTQKVTVQPKNKLAPSYEIVMDNTGRDPSDSSGGAPKSSAGQRVWRLFNF